MLFIWPKGQVVTYIEKRFNENDVSKENVVTIVLHTLHIEFPKF